MPLIYNLLVAFQPAQRLRCATFAVVAATASTLGACGTDTELNGKIFDVMGISSAAQAASKTEPKLAARSGLILPPDASRLPEPGTSADPGANALSAVDDPDRKRVMAAAERERLHKAHCSGELAWKERAQNKDWTPKSPYGPCGILGDAIKQ